MSPEDIVCWSNVRRYYGNDSQLVEKYKMMMEKNECPFCSKNITKDNCKLVAETDLWNIIESPYPYKNSALHLLIIPKRHVISLNALYPEEWLQMAKVISIISERYSFLAEGFGLAIREGEIGGVTLFHLHWHLIAPKVEPITGQIAVNFGIG